MAISLTHTTQAVGTDAGNGEIRKAQWNEAHTLTSASNVLLGRLTAGTGAVQEITFEEANFTPTVVGTTVGGTGTYSVQMGRYTRIGSRVFYQVALIWSAHTGTGNIRIGGLPYASEATANNFSAAGILANNLTFSGSLGAATEPGTTQLSVYSYTTGGGTGFVAMDTAASLWVSGHYGV